MNDEAMPMPWNWGHPGTTLHYGACDSVPGTFVGGNHRMCYSCQLVKPEHENCQHGKAVPEGQVHSRRGRWDDPIVYLWLADRICRISCECECRTNGTVQPALFGLGGVA